METRERRDRRERRERAMPSGRKISHKATKTQRGIAATDVVRQPPDYVGQERAQRTQKMADGKISREDAKAKEERKFTGRSQRTQRRRFLIGGNEGALAVRT